MTYLSIHQKTLAQHAPDERIFIDELVKTYGVVAGSQHSYAASEYLNNLIMCPTDAQKPFLVCADERTVFHTQYTPRKKSSSIQVRYAMGIFMSVAQGAHIPGQDIEWKRRDDVRAGIRQRAVWLEKGKIPIATRHVHNRRLGGYFITCRNFMALPKDIRVQACRPVAAVLTA